jgi:hypothetical protein
MTTSRKHSVSFNAIATATSAKDLFEIIAGAVKGFRLCELRISQITEVLDAQDEKITVTLTRASGTYTPGTAGTAIAIVKWDSASSAAVATGKTNNTTQAVVGTGAFAVIMVTALYVVKDELVIRYEGDERPVFNINEALIVAISAPADTITLNGTLIFEEMATNKLNSSL